MGGEYMGDFEDYKPLEKKTSEKKEPLERKMPNEKKNSSGTNDLQNVTQRIVDTDSLKTVTVSNEDECPDGHVEVNVFNFSDGGKTMQHTKIYNKAEAPDVRDTPDSKS